MFILSFNNETGIFAVKQGSDGPASSSAGGSHMVSVGLCWCPQSHGNWGVRASRHFFALTPCRTLLWGRKKVVGLCFGT